jgi:hypothetical protein
MILDGIAKILTGIGIICIFLLVIVGIVHAIFKKPRDKDLSDIINAKIENVETKTFSNVKNGPQITSYTFDLVYYVNDKKHVAKITEHVYPEYLQNLNEVKIRYNLNNNDSYYILNKFDLESEKSSNSSILAMIILGSISGVCLLYLLIYVGFIFYKKSSSKKA